MGTKALMTAVQFGQMITAETEDFELVDGELVRMSSGTLRHAKIRSRIERYLAEHFEKHPMGEAYGEVDCRITNDTVRRPDVAVFLGERLKLLDVDAIPAPFAPDIAVQVLSPSESAIDVRRKVRDYLRAGGHEVWLVDSANGEVIVHVQGQGRVLEGEEVLETALLPGFSVSVAKLLA